MEQVVGMRIYSIQRLPDTRPKDWLGRINTTYPHPSKVGLLAHQIGDTATDGKDSSLETDGDTDDDATNDTNSETKELTRTLDEDTGVK